jgi:hypothetical protein
MVEKMPNSFDIVAPVANRKRTHQLHAFSLHPEATHCDGQLIESEASGDDTP